METRNPYLMRDCSTCGNKCCIAWGAAGLSVTDEDIQKWKEASSHLLRYIVDKKVWFDPDTKVKLSICPFLSKNGCTIYPKDGEADIRPSICGAYPWDKPCLNEIMDKPMVIDDDHQINIVFFARNKW